MPGGEVYVEGLAELRRALRRMDPELLKGVQKKLKKAAKIVADDAQEKASVRSGLMASRTRAFTRGNVAGVRSTATAPDGYPYPRRIEFEKGGVRAFVRPALEENTEEIIEELEDLLDEIANIFDGR